MELLKALLGDRRDCGMHKECAVALPVPCAVVGIARHSGPQLSSSCCRDADEISTTIKGEDTIQVLCK